MHATGRRKLSLNKETLRRLSNGELSKVGGGFIPQNDTSNSGCPTCGSCDKLKD